MPSIDPHTVNHRQVGFSLIELMVVIFIVAIVSSGVGIAVGSVTSPQKQLNEAGRKLYAQMRFAADEALVSYQVFGLRVDTSAEEDNKTRYQWLVFDEEQWKLLKESSEDSTQVSHELLNEVTLAEDLRLEVAVDDELLDDLLENALNIVGEDDSEPIIPAVIFYPNGEVSEFELTLSLVDEEVDDFSIYLDERKQLTNSTEDENSDKQ